MRRVMEISTPLGEDVLLFHRMTAREELSRLSEFQIALLSDKGDIDLDKILGKSVTVKLELPDDKTRYFNGYVTRFAQVSMHGRYHLYQATVRPWLWFLTRTANCRIFQDMTVPDIIKQIFDDHPQIADVKKDLTGNYRTWEYCVQYRETDFNFVSRLMEQEGMYFYFKHVDGRHTLILADSYSAHSPFEDYVEIPFIPQDRAGRLEHERINEWNFAREIQPGRYVIDDFDFQKPSVEQQVRTKIKREHALADYEVYDYPGEYVTTAEGEQVVRTRIEELHAQYELANGSTNARGLCCGHLFKLTGHARADQNREYLVVSAVHNLEYNEYEAMEHTGANYQCGFTVLNSRQPFRPQRSTPKPIVQGPQTAIVVGPGGDEIYTDKYGRVKVHFHWDRQSKEDENSSCWMRVSQVHAGKGFGGIDIPRIGEEVIISFLEGDPDRPIITGRVYNDNNKPPTGLPKAGMVSGLKSNSTPGGGGYNELTMDDTKGKEKITVHGQYDMNTTVKHDQTTTVHNNRTDKVDVDDSETVGNNQMQQIGVHQTVKVGSNQKITVGANRTESVGGAENITITGHRTETVNSGETVTVNGGRSHTVNGVQTTTISVAEVHSVGAGRMHNVGAGEAITVGGAQMVNVGGAQMVSVGGIQKVNVGALQSVSVGGPHKLSAAVISVTSKGPIKIKAGAITMIEAPTIVLKAGGSKIIMNSSGVTIKGAKITIKADGSASIKAGGSIKIKGSNIGED